MAKIKQVIAREILNAKGNPTIETTVILSDGKTGTASVPSGTSIGQYEATELRDHDEKRFMGLGVYKAISNVQEVIAPAIVGLEASRQQEVDRKMIELDGTQNKGRLGANSMLSVSIAVAKAAARSSVLPLFLYLREYIKKDNLTLRIPTPAFNIINGGKHAGNNSADFQEFLIIPATSKSLDENLNMMHLIYNSLGKTLESNGLNTLIGDEGGFAPKLQKNEEGLSLLKQTIEKTHYRFGFDVFLGLDSASNMIYSDKKYHIRDKATPLSASELASYFLELNKKYHLLYLEDPFAEDDWDAWENIPPDISSQVIIVGDDLVATNPFRLQMALDKKAISGVIIKPNQIGTVIESLAVVEVARQAGLKIIVSNRSGDTNDDFIADFAVAVSADYVKFGSPVRGERVSKFNRLLQIDRQLRTL